MGTSPRIPGVLEILYQGIDDRSGLGETGGGVVQIDFVCLHFDDCPGSSLNGMLA